MYDFYNYHDDYKVEIIASNSKRINKNGYEYIALNNNTEYKIKLENNTNKKTDVSVYIDNELAGKWRLNPHSKIILERPSSINKKFLFVDETSKKAKIAGIEIGNTNNGLIKVIFYPEKEYNVYNPIYWSSEVSPIYYNQSINLSRNSSNQLMNSNSSDQLMNSITNNAYDSLYSSGATVLTGESTQQFTSISPLKQIDTEKIKTIILRLIINKYNEKEYISMREANIMYPAYPPRIDDY